MISMGILSETLYLIRKKAGLTQQEVADRLEIARTYYNAIENGQKTCGKEKLQQIAEIPEIKNIGITFGILYGLKLADMANMDTEDVKHYALAALQSKSGKDLLSKEFPHLIDPESV